MNILDHGPSLILLGVACFVIAMVAEWTHTAVDLPFATSRVLAVGGAVFICLGAYRIYRRTP